MRTFEVLENLIVAAHLRGGSVHFWMWGDECRKQTPLRWGANGGTDQRLQRYIAARLGPLPGWSMGYGFDLFEWTNEDMLSQWHSYMHQHMGWRHLLGARSDKNQLNQISETMDYSSYEQHQPSPAMYRQTIHKRGNKPSFSEDRFRVRNNSKYPKKDYTPELTRRGLWHSTMAGGIANIWGYLARADGKTNAYYSLPYPNKEQIKTYFTFLRELNPYLLNLRPTVSSSDQHALVLANNESDTLVLYQEETDVLDLGPLNAKEFKAVDTLKPYKEIKVHVSGQKIALPYRSDWLVFTW